MSGLEDRFWTPLAGVLSVAGVTGLEDVVAVVETVVVLLEPDSVLEVLGFEQPPKFPYMCPSNLPLSSCLPLMFEQPTMFLSSSLLNLDFAFLILF